MSTRTNGESGFYDAVDQFGESDARGLPEKVIAHMWRTVLWEAVRGKYESVTEAQIASCVNAGDTLRPNIGAVAWADILRQLNVLKHIEAAWCCEAIDLARLLELHRMAYAGAAGEHTEWRREELILEGGIRTQVRVCEIDSEMKAYEDLLADASENNLTKGGASTLNYAVRIGATLFIELVRIHPFSDGNGRTARLLTNLLFRRAHLPYVAIPKVRNSNLWREALQVGFDGNFQPVESILCMAMKRMLDSIKSIALS